MDSDALLLGANIWNTLPCHTHRSTKKHGAKAASKKSPDTAARHLLFLLSSTTVGSIFSSELILLLMIVLLYRTPMHNGPIQKKRNIPVLGLYVEIVIKNPAAVFAFFRLLLNFDFFLKVPKIDPLSKYDYFSLGTKALHLH